MNDKENIRYRLARIEGYVVTAHSLLDAAEEAHCECTLDGWLDHYIQKGASSKEQAALWWMKGHYDLISTAVRAARDLAEIAGEQISDVDLDIADLLPEETSE